MNYIEIKLPGAAPIMFFGFAVAALVLSVTVVPQSQVDHVLPYAPVAGAFGLLSFQIWGLGRQIEKLRQHKEDSGPAKPAA
jgi:hypothetical protein